MSIRNIGMGIVSVLVGILTVIILIAFWWIFIILGVLGFAAAVGLLVYTIWKVYLLEQQEEKEKAHFKKMGKLNNGYKKPK